MHYYEEDFEKNHRYRLRRLFI